MITPRSHSVNDPDEKITIAVLLATSAFAQAAPQSIFDGKTLTRWKITAKGSVFYSRAQR